MYDRPLLAVLRLLAASEREEEAIRDVLQILCDAFGWRIALFWRVHPDGSHVSCVEIWPPDDRRLIEFTEASAKLDLGPGQGLPGRVWAQRETIFVEDIRRETNYARQAVAIRCGLNGGAAFPVITGGQVIGVIECYTDRPLPVQPALVMAITDVGAQLGMFLRRVWAEQELREQKEQNRAVVETAGDAIVTMNGAGEITSFNRAAENVFGWNEAAVLGRLMSELMPVRYREAHRTGIARYLETGRRNIPWTAIQLPGLRRDGTEIELEISFGEYTHAGERIFTGVMRDVSQRRRDQKDLEDTTAALEQTVVELRERTRQAEAASRAKSEFLAAMSHELRTPLQAVIGFTSLLQEQIVGPVTDGQAEQLERIGSAAAHLLGLIDQLLDIARAEAGTLSIVSEPIDLCAHVRSTVSLIEPLIAARSLDLRVTDCPDESLRQFMTDPARVRQILINLLTNAAKFTDTGRVHVKTEADSSTVSISVTDTGIGMTPEQRDNVFRAFYQAESTVGRRSPGLGLGLAISLRLAEALNGSITVASEAGVGTTFTLVLPKS